jgi:hypothetical protein
VRPDYRSIGLGFLDDAEEIGRVGHVAIVQMKGDALLVWIMNEMVDALGIERRRAALHAVDAVALG